MPEEPNARAQGTSAGAPLSGPLIAPHLVGRAPHLAAVDDLLGQVGAGSGAVLLVAGEAGIGKSRLVAEMVKRATVRGIATAVFDVYEGDAAVPLAPFGSPNRHLATAGTGELLASALVGDPADPQALLAAVARRVREAAEQRPLLLVVEDVHWADATTLDYLEHVTREIVASSVLLVLTYRHDETSPALAKLLGALERRRVASELRLMPLALNQVEEMLGALLQTDRPLRRGFVERLYAQTEGNPFFVEEIVRSLIATGDLFVDGRAWERGPGARLPLPQSIRDTVQHRVERLAPAIRETLHLAAVIGPRVEFELLQALSGRSEPELIEHVRVLVQAQLLVDESADRIAFRHALTRDAVYDRLLARERRALHARAGEALERTYEDSLDQRWMALSYHFSEAQAWERALRYGLRAGDQAAALHHPAAAVEHFNRAIEAAERLGQRAPLEAWRGRARALGLVGDIERARKDLEHLLEIVRAEGDREAEWAALIDLGQVWAGHDYARMADCYHAALAIAREFDDRSRLAQTLNGIGNLHVNAGDPTDALPHHLEALAIFEDLGDRESIAQTLDLLGMASYGAGDLRSGTAYYERAAVLLADLGDRRALASCLSALSQRGWSYQCDVMSAEPRWDGIARAERALELAREMGWPAGEAYALICLASCLGPSGAFQRALDTVGSGIAIAEDVEHHEWLAFGHIVRGAILIDLLATDDARVSLERALAEAELTGNRHWRQLATCYLVDCGITTGDHAAAQGALDREPPSTMPRTMGERHIHFASAELALARGRADEARASVEHLIEIEQSAGAGSERAVIPRLWRLRGEALAAQREFDEARAVLRTARDRAAEEGALPLLWRIDVSLAGVLRRKRDRAGVDGALASARTVIEELATRVADDGLRRAFMDRAAHLVPRPRPSTPLRAAKAAYGGLTAREREIAGLVGLGYSNRQIAERLVLGERTVQTHVSGALNKLGFTSRAQIAAWATEQGLVPPDGER